MPVPGCRVQYVAAVDVALVVGTGVAGLAVGGVLDPVGQRLADRSRAIELRRQAERAGGTEVAGADPSIPDPSIPSSGPGTELAAGGPAGGVDSGRSDQLGGPRAGSLVRRGPSRSRTALAAVVTGALFAALAVHFGPDVELAPFCVFVATLVTVSVTDLSHRLVPRWLIYGATVAVVPLFVASAAADARWRSLTGAGVAGAAAFAVFFAIWWFVPQGMGYGDVRLAGLIGLCTGYLSLFHAYLAFLAGFVIGLVFGVVLMAAASTGRKTRIPFAPALAAGAVLAIFFGGHLAHSLFGAGG